MKSLNLFKPLHRSPALLSVLIAVLKPFDLAHLVKPIEVLEVGVQGLRFARLAWRGGGGGVGWLTFFHGLGSRGGADVGFAPVEGVPGRSLPGDRRHLPA